MLAAALEKTPDLNIAKYFVTHLDKFQYSGNIFLSNILTNFNTLKDSLWHGSAVKEYELIMLCADLHDLQICKDRFINIDTNGNTSIRFVRF